MPEKAAHAPIMLAELGVRLVLIEGLPRTKIDGAAFFLNSDPSMPVIALSLRVDRMESVPISFAAFEKVIDVPEDLLMLT